MKVKNMHLQLPVPVTLTPLEDRNSCPATHRQNHTSLGQWADRLLTVAMLSCFLVGGWLLIPQLQTKAHSATVAQSKRQPTAPSKVLETTSIEEIRLGERVVARNPLRHETSAPSNITPETWREIRLSMTQDGVEYQLAFLRDLNWIHSVNAAPGATIHLNLKEMGLNGPALVESITDCPPIEPDDGTGRMVVTGTMCHLAENIFDLHVTGLDEPIGVTNTHPIWSEDRQAFVRAGQLCPGENLRSESGVTSQVTRITPHRGPPELTYNLEVDGEHVYAISGLGLLAHNSCLFDSRRVGHIFRDAPGHVNPSSPTAREAFAKLFERTGSNPANLRTDAVQAQLITQHAAAAGVKAFTQTMRNGKQIWVTVKDGLIQNAGVNLPGALR